MKAWVPATLVALVLAIGIGAAAYFAVGRGNVGSASPTPSVDLHSDAAVIAAIKHYYDVESEARKTGNADLIDPVTLGHASIASQNFHAYVADQAAKNRRSVIDHNYFSDWSVTLEAASSTALYHWWLHGYDTNAATGQPVESQMTSTKGSYRALLVLKDGRWLVSEVQLVQDDVP